MLTIIAGSRSAKRHHVIDGISKCPWADQITKVISGTAWGADRWGETYAESQGIEVIRFPAEWDIYGMSAGPRRNKEMAENADSLIAIYDGTSRGTASMLRYAQQYGLKSFVYYFAEGRSEVKDFVRKPVQSDMFSLIENRSYQYI
tara:strand:- start:1885 stop:2322 length:438 start_codon:yes stop_codon:yes gene_type:complete